MMSAVQDRGAAWDGGAVALRYARQLLALARQDLAAEVRAQDPDRHFKGLPESPEAIAAYDAVRGRGAGDHDGEGSTVLKASTPIDPVEVLRARVADAGSQRTFAARHGVSAQHVLDVLRGRQGPGPKLLAIIGLQRVTSYERISPCSTP